MQNEKYIIESSVIKQVLTNNYTKEKIIIVIIVSTNILQ
jgi:hypothetical protein